MNEKGLEQLILDNTFVGRVASFTEEYPDGEPTVRGAGLAAHAVANKLAEGVVAKIDGRWTTDDLGYHVLTVDSHSNWEGQKIRMATVMQGQLENYYGQLVTVTVTKEE